MATPLLARFFTKKIAGCTNASHDFPPRKYNILLPTRGWHLIPFPSPQGMYGRAYADVTPKISRMDSLLNHLSYGAPLASPYAREDLRYNPLSIWRARSRDLTILWILYNQQKGTRSTNSPHTVTCICIICSVPALSLSCLILQIYAPVSVSVTGSINNEPLERSVKRGSSSVLTRLRFLYHRNVGWGYPSAEHKTVSTFPTRRFWW